MADFKNELKNRGVSTGELRIIASIIDEGKNIIGFGVMIEANGRLKPYTYPQVVVLLNQCKFVNATLLNGEISILDSSINRLPKFNSRLDPIDSTKNYVIIKSELYKIKNSKSGDSSSTGRYRVIILAGLNCTGSVRIVELGEDEIIQLEQSHKYVLVNAKVVNRGSKKILSAIKGEFLKDLINIPKVEDKPIVRQNKIRQETLYIHNQHVMKLRYNALDMFKQTVYKGNHGNERLISRRIEKRLGPLSHKRISKEKELELLTEDVITNIIEFNVDILKVLKNNKVPFVVKAASVLQYYYRDGDIALSNISIDSLRIVNILKELRIAEPAVLKLINDVNKRENSKQHIRDFNTTKFDTAEDIAQLGFAINSSNSGLRYKTKCGSIYKLKYIGQYITDYTKYKNAACFGDLMSLVVAEKSIEYILRLEDKTDKVGKAEYEYQYKIKESIAKIEIALCMLAFYNYDLAKQYYTDVLKKKLDEHEITSGAGINFDNFIGLDEKSKDGFRLYYESGYCVVENVGKTMDKDQYKDWDSNELKKATYINVRRSLKLNEPAAFNRDLKISTCKVISKNILKSSLIDIENTIGLMRVM